MGFLTSKMLAVGLLAANFAREAWGQDLPEVVDDDFELSQVYSTLHVSGSPTQTLFSPCSDHVLLFGKAGQVNIYPAADEEYTFVATDRESLETLVELGDELNSWGDHGLLSAQLHPDFPAEPYLFLFFSIAPDGWTGECTNIIDGLPFCAQYAVVDRLKIDITVANDGTCSDWSFTDSTTNRVRLMENWCASANAHHNAAMEFYMDGSLLVANGDSAQASFDRGYPDEDQCYDDDEPQPQGYFRAQNDKFLHGHMIRIPSDAVMYDAEDLPLTEDDYDVWAKGLRNPFRLDTDMTTGDIYIGDVGHITVEEINILRNPLEASEGSLPANFGWPCVEGDGVPLPTFNWISQSCDTATENCDICESLFACTGEVEGDAECDPTYVPPSFQYDHSGSLTEYDGQEGLCTFTGNSISAIAFFEGRLYAADYSKKCIWYFEAASDGSPDMTKPRIIAQDAGAEIVDLVDGRDGLLYGTNFALSKLLRIDPVGLQEVNDSSSDDTEDESTSTSSVTSETTSSSDSTTDAAGGSDTTTTSDDEDVTTSSTTSSSSSTTDDAEDSDAPAGSNQNATTSGTSSSSTSTKSAAAEDASDVLAASDRNETTSGTTSSSTSTTDVSADADADTPAPTPSAIEETPSPTAEELKPPNARLRVSTGGNSGYCDNPCELEAGAEVRFTALLSGSYGDTNITEYSITYGDGSKGYTGPDGGGHQHTYEDHGVFVAEATVTDSEGLTGTETLTMIVGEPFSFDMNPKSGKWVVGDTITFNLTRAKTSTAPDSITWASSIEHCTTNSCTGKTGCHLHSLSKVDTASDDMSGSVVPIAHALPSQVIITARMMFGHAVIDYEWPTSAKSRSVTVASEPAGLIVYYDDQTCQYTPCIASFMSESPASFMVSSIQSINMQVYEFRRWKVINADNSTDISQQAALNNLMINTDGMSTKAEYQARTPQFSNDIAPPVVTAVGGYYTKLAVEWDIVPDKGVDHVIVYAQTPDHNTNTYQSSKALLSGLGSSAELLVPAGSSNYTVYLRSYNSINNTISAKSTQHVVASGATFNPNDLCPDEIPAVAEDEEEDEEEEEGEGGGESAKVVASTVPGIIQAEDFDVGGEGVAYHDNTTKDEGATNYRKKEGVDLERGFDNTINVAWTEPGEWLTYTVEHEGNGTVVLDVAVRYAVIGGSNGIALALDLNDPNNCAGLEPDNDKVIMLNGNLPQTGGHSSWAWTGNASVALEPGPHVVTLCFIEKGSVNVDLLRFSSSMCGDGACESVTRGETCSTCPQDCGMCSTPFTSLVLPGVVEAEDYDVGGEGVSFHEATCKSSQSVNCTERLASLSDYRDVPSDISSDEGFVGLQEAEGDVVWGWTTQGEWLLYTVTATATADYNVTLRYASASTGKVNLFLDAYTCDSKENPNAFLGSSTMVDSGGETGPFARTAPFTTRLEAGQHTIRVCVAKGGFSLDEITFDMVTSGSCNDDGTCDVTKKEGCASCQSDCTCSEGEPYGGIASSVPGFVYASNFDEGVNGVAYWDDSARNLGGEGSRNASVDLEAGDDGTLHVGYGIPGEWLKYTVFASESGVFDVSVRYATLANSTALSVTVDDESDLACNKNSPGTVLYKTDLPSSRSWSEWADTDPVEVSLPAGSHVFKLCILNIPGGADTNLKGLNIKAAKTSSAGSGNGK